ncbi:MAG: hydroxyisourate hydrolase [Candidatus Acidiferrales bacterium]
MNSLISTHVLDTSIGRPAEGLEVTLDFENSDGRWQELARGVTSADGRVSNFELRSRLQPGTYRLVFETAKYFAARQQASFYPRVEVIFHVTDVSQHYHVPLLLSPFSYSTYRGS